MNQSEATQISTDEKTSRRRSFDKLFYFAIIICAIMLFSIMPVAAADMWTKANEIMKDVYNKVLGISTIAAVVTVSVALLLMNFSKNGRTVDESRAWIKRIAITWAILNGLGFIMTYLNQMFAGGRYTP